MSESQEPRTLDLTGAQLRATRSLVRRAMLAVLMVRGEASIKDLAAAVGRSPQALYRHMSILESSGLAKRSGHRGDGRDREVLYSAARGYFTPPDRDLTLGERRSLAELASIDLRMMDRAYGRVVLDTSQQASGADRVAGRMTQMMWLTPDERRQLNADLQDVIRRFNKDRSPAHSEDMLPYMVLLTFAPWDVSVAAAGASEEYQSGSEREDGG